MRVLLLEPDPSRARGFSLLLREQHVDVDLAATPDEATRFVNSSNKYTAIVLEDDLAPMTGREWIQMFRESNHGTPAVLLTENADPHHKIDLLDAGADDVILHPLSGELLPAYVRALARRCQPGKSALLQFEDLSLDLRSWQISRRGETISCTSREVAVLEYFLRNRQRVVTRAELTAAVWDGESLPDSNVIEVFIARLRRKIDKPFDVPLIHTIVGRGYMLSVSKPGAQALPQ